MTTRRASSVSSNALAAAILVRVGPLLRAGGIDPVAVTCTVSPSGPRLHVVFTGPPPPQAVERVLGVRVLDAVCAAGKTVGEVDVRYQATARTGPHDDGLLTRRGAAGSVTQYVRSRV